jgi:hypothetical protein
MGLGDDSLGDPIFNGHFFQDLAEENSDGKPFDLVSIFAPLLDAQMMQHKCQEQIHRSRVKELRNIEAEIKALTPSLKDR